MASQWYYAIGDKENGPVSSQELKKLADSGQLSPTDQVWKEGMAEWTEAGSIPNLFSGAVANVGSSPTGSPAIDTGASESPFIATDSTGPSPPFTRGSASSQSASRGANVAQQAGTDALEAFKLIASNPVGGLADSYHMLGSTRALQAGIVFGIVVALCPTIGAGFFIRTMSGIAGGFSGGDFDIEIVEYIKFLFCVLLLPLSFSGGCALSRVMFAGKNGYESDLFIASASLLPLSLFSLVAGLIGEALGLQIILALLVFAESTSILMLYSGVTRIHGISDRVATLAVPLIMIVGFLAFYFAMKVILFS